jgi:hypothetical protein
VYYIIETEEQLQKFSTYDFTNCIVDVVPSNDNCHPKLADISLIYIKPFRSRMGFMLCLDHTEAFSLPKEAVEAFISDKLGNIYAIDGKRMRYFTKRDSALYCLKMAKYLSTGEIIDESKFNTTAHNFFCQKYEYRPDINKIIPIAKHFEKYEKLAASIKIDQAWFKPKYYKLYGDVAPRLFNSIESDGISIDNVVFISHYTPKGALMSVKSDKTYTQYNLYTATGRPSNAFNGINYGAMNKTDGSRKAFVYSNDRLVEFDYSSYHIRILAYLIGYKFEDEDIHTHLAKYYFDTNDITREQYEESKGLTFKLLYTDSVTEEIKDIPFFAKVKEFKDYLWNLYKKQGYIESFLSKRPIIGITSKTQVLPFILQNYETERNILVLNDIFKYLCNKKTKLVLYNYDSFLFDYSKEDGKQALCDIQMILEQDGYKTSCKYGQNYQEMKNL